MKKGVENSRFLGVFRKRYAMRVLDQGCLLLDVFPNGAKRALGASKIYIKLSRLILDLLKDLVLINSSIQLTQDFVALVVPELGY